MAALQRRACYMATEDRIAVEWACKQLGTLTVMANQATSQINRLRSDLRYMERENARLQMERKDAFKGWLEACNYTHSKATRDVWAFVGFGCQLGALVLIEQLSTAPWTAVSIAAGAMLVGNVATVVSCLKGKRPCRPPK